MARNCGLVDEVVLAAVLLLAARRARGVRDRHREVRIELEQRLDQARLAGAAGRGDDEEVAGVCMKGVDWRARDRRRRAARAGSLAAACSRRARPNSGQCGHDCRSAHRSPRGQHATGGARPAAPGEILALGEPMVEFNCTGAGDGRLYLQGFGGDTSNFAIAAARQGARVGCLGALGDDANGRMLRALWDAEGIDHRDVRTDAAAYTAIYFVTHGAQGHEFSFFRQGSAASRMQPARTAARAHRGRPRAAPVGHHAGHLQQCLRHRLRRHRHRACGRRDGQLRHQPAPEAVAAGACARADRGGHRAQRHLPAQPGRSAGAHRPERCRCAGRPLPAARREDGGAEARRGRRAGGRRASAPPHRAAPLPLRRCHRRRRHLRRRLRRAPAGR